MTVREALDRTILLCRDFVRPAEASDDDIVEALTGISVSVVADAVNLQTAAAQAAVVALAGQVLGYGGRLRLIIPDVPVVGHQPPLRSQRLRSGLVELTDDSMPGARAEVAIEPNPDDFVFVVGSTPWTRSRSIRVWRLGGTRWSGTIAPPGVVVPVWPDEFPLGALVAATAAAAEPFKDVLAGMLTRVGAATRHQELRAARAATVRLGEDDLSIGPMSLGDIDVVSGGAITISFLHVLLRFPRISGHLRIFEPEVLELTNLNRYVLARRHQLGMKKVHALMTWQTPSHSGL